MKINIYFIILNKTEKNDFEPFFLSFWYYTFSQSPVFSLALSFSFPLSILLSITLSLTSLQTFSSHNLFLSLCRSLSSFLLSSCLTLSLSSTLSLSLFRKFYSDNGFLFLSSDLNYASSDEQKHLHQINI